MKLIYKGKTKDVYELDNKQYLLKFKDDVTGTDGVFDPGANTVALSIDGMGLGGLRLTEFFFKKINDAGFATHFVSADIDRAEMTVLPAQIFGQGIEVVCRFHAVGSFLRRYGQYVQEGQKLHGLVEITLKDDDRGDPLIIKDALAALGILTADEYDKLRELTKNISGLIRDELALKGLELFDIKLEFGRVGSDIVLIDEISGGNMRVYQGGHIVAPLDLVRLVLD
ncbi:MAG: phosphoribosylaminoimidazolesuccinocarboxamide synthase [Oscillospiraceae bacterium]|nr:phosphoribosylaminoimidazolesuccinocarboxamide synthase [Oscillospiraceae bacterium]